MALCRLIYSSRSNDNLSAEALNEILEISRTNNARAGVTGALMYGAREFLQCLEGSREAINATYARIINDKRHAEVTILDFCEIDRRWFAGWGMHHVPPLWSSREKLLRYGERESFNPLKISAASARALLGDLALDLTSESVSTARFPAKPLTSSIKTKA
jgi:hypothetical protein